VTEVLPSIRMIPRRAARIVAGLALAILPAAVAWPSDDDAFLGAPLVSARKLERPARGQETAVEHNGPGWLHSAQVVKQGGENGETYVAVELDGSVLYATSFGSLQQPWREVDNPYMLANVRRAGDTHTLTIWYTPPVRFRGQFGIRVEVREPGVETLYISAVHSLPRDQPD
jgi:hypothetical protein